MADTMEQAASLFARMQAQGRSQALVPDPRPALGTALMQTMAQSIPWPVVQPIPVLLTRYLCGRETARDLGLDRRVPLASSALFWAMLLLARGIDTLVRWWRPRFSISRTLTRVLGYHFMSRVLMGQTRPLQLPDQLLGQMDDAMARWSDDPRAPGWLNRLEDRLTTPGRWKRKRRSNSPAPARRPPFTPPPSTQ